MSQGDAKEDGAPIGKCRMMTTPFGPPTGAGLFLRAEQLELDVVCYDDRRAGQEKKRTDSGTGGRKRGLRPESSAFVISVKLTRPLTRSMQMSTLGRQIFPKLLASLSAVKADGRILIGEDH